MKPKLTWQDSRLRVVPFADLTDAELLACYRQILEPSFMPAELMTYEELSQARGIKGAGGIAVFEPEGPLAILVIEEYLSGRVRLLSYLAVAALGRGRGLGSRVMAIQFPADARSVGLAEIEDPRFYPKTAHNDPVARLRFYYRWGARLLPLAYMQPSLRPDSPRVENLLLIAIAASAENLDKQLVTDFLDEYFTVCEGPQVLAEPGFLALRQAVTRGPSKQLPLLPMTELDAARRAAPNR